MIRYLQRNQIEDEKYNDCIDTSIQSRIYAYSWYLDIVTDNWSVFVLDDYKAVMPLPWRNKLFLKYVYTPLWILELGVFSKSTIDESLFYKSLRKKFLFSETRLNSGNTIELLSKNSKLNQFQFLKLNTSLNELTNNYRKDRKRDLKKAESLGLLPKWDNNIDGLLNLFKNNVGKRILKISEKDYNNLKNVILKCIEMKKGNVLTIYQDNVIVASGFFVTHNYMVTKMVDSTDFSNRRNGANTFLIQEAIKKYNINFDVFNFGGSSIESIANYSKSFGASTIKYQQLNFFI